MNILFNLKISALSNIFKEKMMFSTENKNLSKTKTILEKRISIIEKLKIFTRILNQTNLFRAIREIKEEWSNAGQVAKSEFKNLNNYYFYHLNNFYQMLDLNKEYREQEYAHNLEKRQHIIARAKNYKTNL